MDHECRYQDLLRCHNCDTLNPPLYCDICHVHLCKNCGEKHFSDASTEHTKVVPFKSRKRATKCKKHISEICERYCEQCEIPVCVRCASNQNSRKLTTAISKHGKDLQRELDNVIEKMKADVIEIESKHMAVLNKHENEIKRSLFEITKIIVEVKKLLDSEDVCHVTAYKSKNAEFRKLSPKFEVSLPSFTPKKFNKENINQYVGSLSVLPEDGNNTMDAQGTESSPLSSPLIDEARVITNINIKGGDSILLTNVSCLSDAQIWTCSINGNIMLLYDLRGKLVALVRTKSGRKPEDIAVTKNGDLAYTDYSDGSVNIVKNRKIQTVVKLRDWRPRGVCSTNSGELLVVMEKDDDEETKIVRYSGSIEKKIIQYNNKGQFLTKDEFSNKYISENRNFDICVSDYRASAVVVFNQAGKRQFIYTGHFSSTKEPFYPCGITTDSQSRILTAEVDKGHPGSERSIPPVH